MFVPLAKLAEAIEIAKERFFDVITEPTERSSGVLMVSYILQALSLKEPTEGVVIALQRMRQMQITFDLLNQEHRNFLSKVMKDMFGPLGVTDVVILGITGEKKVFITTMHDEHDAKTDISEIKKLLQAIVNTEDAEDFSL